MNASGNSQLTNKPTSRDYLFNGIKDSSAGKVELKMPEPTNYRVQVFLRRLKIERYRLLTRGEERFLIKAYRHGIYTELVMDAIVKCNMGLVKKVAERYTKRGIPFDDLVAAGMCAIVLVINKFDIERNNRISTIAVPWLHQHMQREIENKSKIVRIPEHMYRWMFLYNREVSSYKQLFGSEPTDDYLMEKMEIKSEKLAAIRDAFVKEPISFDAPKRNGDEEYVPDTLRDDRAILDFERALENANFHIIWERILRLEERERSFIVKKFGLDGSEPRTLRMIAAEYGISFERVRQVTEIAIQKIKHGELAEGNHETFGR